MFRVLALLAGPLLPVSALAASVVCNTTSITIPALGVASVYPSTVTVSGLTSTVRNVLVTVNGLSHTHPNDLGIVLQGPAGVALLLQDGSGDLPETNVTYSFSDFSETLLPDSDAVQGGIFRPTSYFTADSFDAPGPLQDYENPGPADGATATLTSTFRGSQSNGSWKLFVKDFDSGDSGSISNGWCLAINDIIFANAFGF